MKTVAFVPIRLNSRRVEGKNLRLLGGRPLMTYILDTLRDCERIDETYVYCSDPDIARHLPDGVKFLRRDPALDSDSTLGEEIYDAFTREVDADIYVLAHATSPFIRRATVDDAVARVGCGEYDSAFSAERIQTFAWYEGRTLNYSPERVPRTQDLEPVFVETSAFFRVPPRGVARHAPPHRPPSLHGRHRPHRKHGHRLSRRFPTGRGHSGRGARRQIASGCSLRPARIFVGGCELSIKPIFGGCGGRTKGASRRR